MAKKSVLAWCVVNLCWLPSSDLLPSQAHIKLCAHLNGQHSSLFTIYDAKTCCCFFFCCSLGLLVLIQTNVPVHLVSISQIFRRFKQHLFKHTWDTMCWGKKTGVCWSHIYLNSHWHMTIRSRPNYPLIAIDVLESIDKYPNASICTHKYIRINAHKCSLAMR